MKRVLFFTHEQRRLYFYEPAYLEVYRPILESGVASECGIYVYQRDIRWLRSLLERKLREPDLGSSFNTILRELISQKINEFRPTHIVYSVAWPEESVQATTWMQLRSEHDFYLTSIIWDHDEARAALQEFDRSIISASDRTIILDSFSRTERIRSRADPYQDFSGAERVVFCPTVPSPSLFFPRGGEKSGVSLVGSSEGHRIKIERHLRQAGIQFDRIGGLMEGDKFLTDEEYARGIAQSKIVINTQTVDKRTQLKGRVAQVLSCGTFLLEQENEESRHYLSGIPVVFWSAEHDLVEKIKYYMENDIEREEIAKKCWREWTSRYSISNFARVALGLT